MRKYNNFILDVGAFDGSDGLMLALKNKDYFIYAFEANLFQYRIIKKNKLILESRIGKKIFNYKVLNLAVSNKNSNNKLFYVSNNPIVSSLNKFNRNVGKTWKGYDKMFKIKKSLNVKTITLAKFCATNNINIINYLHCDTQGNDLKVFHGLGKYKKILERGVMECSINKYRSLYQGNHTLSQVKKTLSKDRFKIFKIENVDGTMGNEFNVFYKKKFSLNKNYKINLKYNTRYLRRIFSGKTYLKDDIRDFFLRLYNKNFLKS
jgi:FkbM family methyltransferase